jgi:HAD superfamily hydrolase (TIGR01549 family)
VDELPTNRTSGRPRRVRAVFFDVGETLVDEERWWRELCERSGLQPHVVWTALGVTIARGEEHDALWGRLGVERPQGWEELTYSVDDLYPDATACLVQMRDLGLFVGIVGNQTHALEEWARASLLPADLVSSSASLGVRKPDSRFFERIVELAGAAADEVAYVGDRVDNDIVPALAAGLVAVHARRGPWGRLQETPPGALAVDDLASLPQALASIT